jgi:hypothetical protein
MSSANPTPAQEEFQELLNKNSGSDSPRVHPEDKDDDRRDNESEEDEEDRYLNEQIDAAMRMPSLKGPSEGGNFKLPPAAFDSGRATGVKGVIADARAYEEARQTRWRDKIRAARRSVFGMNTAKSGSNSQSEDSEGEFDPDEEAFLQQWRDSRRQELEKEAQGGVRNRRTSPSLRMFGRMDTVDALGYLDAIEKVGRETIVVVFVYDHEVRPSIASDRAKDHVANELNSAKYQVSSTRHCGHWLPSTHTFTSSRSITRTLSSTMLPCPQFSPTETKEISLPT